LHVCQVACMSSLELLLSRSSPSSTYWSCKSSICCCSEASLVAWLSLCKGSSNTKSGQLVPGCQFTCSVIPNKLSARMASHLKPLCIQRVLLHLQLCLFAVQVALRLVQVPLRAMELILKVLIPRPFLIQSFLQLMKDNRAKCQDPSAIPAWSSRGWYAMRVSPCSEQRKVQVTPVSGSVVPAPTCFSVTCAFKLAISLPNFAADERVDRKAPPASKEVRARTAIAAYKPVDDPRPRLLRTGHVEQRLSRSF
jgi:hypothetical protein